MFVVALILHVPSGLATKEHIRTLLLSGKDHTWPHAICLNDSKWFQSAIFKAANPIGVRLNATSEYVALLMEGHQEIIVQEQLANAARTFSQAAESAAVELTLVRGGSGQRAARVEAYGTVRADLVARALAANQASCPITFPCLFPKDSNFKFLILDPTGTGRIGDLAWSKAAA